MSYEHPNQEMPENKTEGLEQSPAKLGVEELRNRMARLREQIKEAGKHPEPEAETKPQKSVAEKRADLDKNYAEGKDIEAKKEELAGEIATIEDELREFEQMTQQAKEMGIPVEDDAEFSSSLQTEKDKLASLEKKQADLFADAKGMANDKEIMGEIHGEAGKEYGERRSEVLGKTNETREQARASLKDALRRKLGGLFLVDRNTGGVPTQVDLNNTASFRKLFPQYRDFNDMLVRTAGKIDEDLGWVHDMDDLIEQMNGNAFFGLQDNKDITRAIEEAVRSDENVKKYFELSKKI